MQQQLEETEENSSIVASGARSARRRAENLTPPVIQSLPVTQNGKRSKKSKNRQTKT